MTDFPGSPRILKGAIVSVGTTGSQGAVIVFQYNPDTLTRSLTAQTAGAGGNRGEALRLKGPPEETVRLEIEIDATDQLAEGNQQVSSLGLHPTLAALELLLYPSSGLMIANQALAAVGVIEIIPPEAPLTLFIWGPKRVLPVRLTEISVTEEAHDVNLNPTRAKVSLSLRVLTYQDLGLLSRGGSLHMAHQVAKEALARLNSNPGLSATGASF